MILIFIGDFIMGVDIVITFFLAYADEGSMTYVTDFSKIANRYIFDSDFVLDFIILLPLSSGAVLIAKPLEIIAMIKAYRFK